MTPEQMALGLKKLKASYPTMAPLEDSTTAAYAQELGMLKWEDFSEAAKVCVRTSKFFPSISELISAADDACRKRMAQLDHEEREERLALQAGEDAIMDPKSSVHGVIQGPNHQRFIDMIEGRIVLPEPEWMKRKGNKGARAWSEGEAYPSMMPSQERAGRVDFLKQQAAMLLAEQSK